MAIALGQDQLGSLAANGARGSEWRRGGSGPDLSPDGGASASAASTPPDFGWGLVSQGPIDWWRQWWDSPAMKQLRQDWGDPSAAPSPPAPPLTDKQEMERIYDAQGHGDAPHPAPTQDDDDDLPPPPPEWDEPEEPLPPRPAPSPSSSRQPVDPDSSGPDGAAALVRLLFPRTLSSQHARRQKTGVGPGARPGETGMDRVGKARPGPRIGASGWNPTPDPGVDATSSAHRLVFQGGKPSVGPGPDPRFRGANSALLARIASLIVGPR